MGERLTVRGFVITREEWTLLGAEGQREILSALPERWPAATKAQGSTRVKRLEPLPLPPTS